MAKDWLDNMNEQRSHLRAVTRDLHNLSDALFMVGNETLALRLNKLGNSIASAEEEIKETVHKKVNDDHASAVELSNAVYQSALAGAELERKSSG